jgi:two-component system NtrC family sensor kinase
MAGIRIVRGWLGRSAVGPLRVLLVASLAVPALLLLVLAVIAYRAAFDESERDAIRTVDVAFEHAASVFDGERLVADRINDEIDELDDAAVRRNEAVLHVLFKRIVEDLEQVQSVLVLDGSGRAMVGSGAFPVDRAVDFADRDYFVALRDGNQPFYVTRLQRSRMNGEVFFGLARRRSSPAGGFAGVVAVAVAPTLFEGFWTTLTGTQGKSAGASDAAGKVVALVRADGEVLAHYPPLPERVHAGPSDLFLQAIQAEPVAGAYVGRSAIDADHPERRVVYRRLRGYPLYVVVGRSTDAVVRAWRGTVLSQLLFGVPAAAVLFLVTLVALRRTRRELAALDQLRDEMTRREAAEATIRQVQRMEAVGQLTSGVAHDFNNLLTIIIGNFELIERAPERLDRVRRLAGNGMIAARRGADLTSKLLSFSRRQMTRPEVLDLNQLIGEFGPVLRQGATEAVSVVLDLAPDLPPVRLDPGQLEAAVLNLVANARDAMPDGGVIRIETAVVALDAGAVAALPDLMPGRYLRIAVADEGTGMDPEVAARAFEPFFTTKEVGRGTGLGLSQVYGFCRQAGGTAQILSAVGRGATVEMYLPLATAADLPAAAPSVPGGGVAPPVAGERVLVVEDEAGVLEMAVESLRDLGYHPLAVTNAAAALEALRADPGIGVLFSDVVMPGRMDGIALAREARRLRPDLRILLTTGYASQRRVPDDIALLQKPYRREDLARALRGLSALSDPGPSG